MSSNFSPTSAELAIVAQIFAQADPQKLGVLTGEVAVRVFTGAKLPPATLGEIWTLSDEEDKGWLPKKGVAIAVRLIGWAQTGEKISQALANRPGPLAVIEGITPVSQQATVFSSPKSPAPAFPPLTPQDKAKFQTMFFKYVPTNGLLSGEKSKNVFVKSRLSNEHLLKIWTLADTQDRGALDATDFAIGMYFIQGLMTGKISFIPTSLPPGLYQQASSLTTPMQSQVTGNSGSFSPVANAFPQQLTGQNSVVQPDFTGLSAASKSPSFPRSTPLVHGNGHAKGWDVTPVEKATFDRYFDSLDTQKRGIIEGEVAVPFMLESHLSGEVLAQVWDLADINNDGRLTKEGFAIAMHLIQKKLAGQDIPAALPQSLVPPSMHGSIVGSSSSFSPANHNLPEATPDLFSFDDTPPPTAAPAKPHPTVPSAPIPSKLSAEADPFAVPPFQTSTLKDLLSDDDLQSASSPPIHDQSAEIGNLKNQLQSTNASLANAIGERNVLEQTVTGQASQLTTFQTQLSSAKAAYETEISLLATLKERHLSQVAEIQKSKEDLIRAESDLSAIRVEKAEIEGSFLRDKEDARDLQRQMMEAGQQVESLKVETDKLRKEAKQQKGLLAIARKQLSSKETEKAKAEREHREAIAELQLVSQEKEGAETSLANFMPFDFEQQTNQTSSPSNSLIFAASQPLPATPDPTLPTKSNNPFDRLAVSSDTLFVAPVVAISPTSVAKDDSLTAPSNLNELAAVEKVGDDLAVSIINYGTELPLIGDELLVPSPNNVKSPATANSTEYFMTPPTTATHETDMTSTTTERFPPLEDISGPIPLISSLIQPPAKVDTNLNAPFKELEVEEDSDSNDSDDETFLKGTSLPTSTTTAPTEKEATQVPNPVASFDDVFVSNEPKHERSDDQTSANPSSLVPVNQVVSSQSANNIPEIVGLNDFDESLGKLPGHPSTATASFSFDTAFDDTFDFASASLAAATVHPIPQVNEKVVVPAKNDFDKMFEVNATTPGKQVDDGSIPSLTIPKFESSFGGLLSGSDSLTLPKLDAISSPPRSREGSSLPGPSSMISSTPSSPKQLDSMPRAVELRSAIKPEKSSSSPKPRLYSSSSKDIQEKKDTPARHSKLSIRLPFGKKKKNPEPVPPPTQRLSPVMQHPHLATPTSDDVESVKQLLAMGFSRNDAVDVLEKHGYDLQKALNSLLGQ